MSDSPGDAGGINVSSVHFGIVLVPSVVRRMPNAKLCIAKVGKNESEIWTLEVLERQS